MALITMRDVCWGFDIPPLLENISLTIKKGERVCLLGRNGVGKSTLLKLISGQMVPDRGDIQRQSGIKISGLAQEVPEETDESIFDVVAAGCGETGRAFVEYRNLNQHVDTITAQQRHRMEGLRSFLDTRDGWDVSQMAEKVLSRTDLNPEEPFANLSAGMKRRALFARALVHEPDVLLLDEPTNHLDIDTILWMEAHLLRFVKTLLFVTHDRFFVSGIANRILELDRGHLFSYAADYNTYLKHKEADLLAEQKQNAVFDKKLSQEETWIRQGIKARRTRNEGRVKALFKMREAFKARRQKTGTVRLQVQEAERSGKLVIRAKNIDYSYDDVPIIKDFSFVLMRGDKVGIIGRNGAGKTTLLNLLLKNIPLQSGTVRHGTHLKVAYFDQLRAQLDDTKTVAENIAEDNDFIVFNGVKRHVISHLKDFLFTPDRCRTPVRVLSGGEKNRLLLAKLFTLPANVLVLDEPTNDLDMETLELLEELFLEYTGTVILVSHDRSFLNNVVTSTLVFEGKGAVAEYVGGYDDWLTQRPKPAEKPIAAKKKIDNPKPGNDNKSVPESVMGKPKKLGFNEQRDLKKLPGLIEVLEAEHNELSQQMSDPAFYKKEKQEITRIKARFDELTKEIDQAYKRWEDLEGRNQ